MPKATLRHARFEWEVPAADEAKFCEQLRNEHGDSAFLADLPDGFVLQSLEVLPAQHADFRVVRAIYLPQGSATKK